MRGVPDRSETNASWVPVGDQRGELRRPFDGVVVEGRQPAQQEGRGRQALDAGELAGHGEVVVFPGDEHLLRESAGEIRERLYGWIPERFADQVPAS